MLIRGMLSRTFSISASQCCTSNCARGSLCHRQQHARYPHRTRCAFEGFSVSTWGIILGGAIYGVLVRLLLFRTTADARRDSNP